MKKLFLLVIFSLSVILHNSTLSAFSSLDYLKSGKNALENGDFLKAEEDLTKALRELKEIGDYILFWRAKAYIQQGKSGEALKDITEIKKNFPNSPILQDARKSELDILKKLDSSDITKVYQNYINDYPDDLSTKFEYAQLLKEKGYLDRAKKIFKEIFLTSSSFADRAEKELSKHDISVNDLIKKARVLNNAYMFRQAEKYLREALLQLKKSESEEVLSLLGYCLFMQKRYDESSVIYKKIGDFYWRGRSLLRGKDFSAFEREMQDYIKSGDQRIGELLINYANIKRRGGNFTDSIKIFKKVIEKYPSYREEAMWYLGWNHYLYGNYDEARVLFKELYLNYGKLKYMYWLDRANEAKGIFPAKQYTLEFRQGDLYSYLFYMKGKITNIPETVNINDNKNLPLRLEILMKADFRQEALKEVKSLIKNNRNIENVPFHSRIAYILGDYPTSVRLISKFPQRYNYHELLYPSVYSDIIIKTSKKFEIEPSLIWAIIREESRFDSFAVSPAGALGLMQLMPNTAKREAKKIGLSIRNDREIFEPEKNITLGSFYLKNLINEFGNIVFAIAAYNAGEGAVQTWISNKKYKSLDEFLEDIPYGETRAYTQRVLTSYFEYLRINKSLNREKISEIIKIKGGQER